MRLVVAAAALALLAIAGVATYEHLSSATDTASSGVTPGERTSGSPSTSTGPSSTGPSSTSPSPSSSPRSSTSTRPRTAAPAGTPTRVRVSTAGADVVDASLEPTLLKDNGELAPPYGTAGWYAEDGWALPGAKGASILVGHIDHDGQPDVFAQLPSVRPGARVTVTYDSGEDATFAVTLSEAVSKAAVPKDETIWDWDSPTPVLRLITCDPTTPIDDGHYEGNWVVWAEPV